MFTGWDGTLYVNEEVKHRRVNPGRAAIMAVILLAIIYTLSEVGLQGVVLTGRAASRTPPPCWSTQRRRSAAAAGPR